MHHARLRAKCLFLAGVGCCVQATPALAQSSNGLSTADIIVTARKREENVQTVPLAVSVQTGAFIKDHQINNAYALQEITPSLTTTSNQGYSGAPQFAIRGIGAAVNGPQVESSVGLVIDDVPMARTELANIEFFDIQRVEVLRGPQGMLFGKNAAAGLINIVSGVPKLGTTEVFGRAEYGNMNTPNSGNAGKINLGANLPIGEDAAIRISGFWGRTPGLYKNIFKPQDLSQEKFGLRAKLKWQPSDSVSLQVAGDYLHVDGPGEALFSARFDTPGGGLEAINTAAGIVASKKNSSIASEGLAEYRSKIHGISVKSDIDIGDGFTITAIGGYRRLRSYQDIDIDILPFDSISSLQRTLRYSQYTGEVRLASPAGERFSYQLGAFYLDLDAKQIFNYKGNLGIPAFPPGVTAALLFEQSFGSKNKSAAAFAESQFKITDQLTLTTGGRYTHDKLDYTLARTNFPGGLLQILPDVNPPLFRRVKKDNVSYRASLDYKINRDVMVYAGYGVGYKGPAFDLFSGDTVGSEKPRNIEVGVKSTLFDNRLRLNFALFDTKFDGFQTQAVSQISSTVSAVKTVNAGSLKTRGFELEGTAALFDGFTVSGGITYLDTKYVDLDSVPCYVNQPQAADPAAPAPGECSTVFLLDPNAFANASGNQLAYAPKWAQSFTIRYEHPVSGEWSAFIQGNGYIRSSFNYQAVGDPGTRQNSLATFGMSLGGRRSDEKLGITLFVRNLTNKRAPVFIGPSSDGTRFGDFFPGRLGDYTQAFSAESYRTFGITADFRF